MAAFHKRELVKPDGRSLILYGRGPLPDGIAVPAPPIARGRDAHLRWHPLLGEWVIYATHRQNRTFSPSATAVPAAGGTAPGAAGDPLAVTTDPAHPTELPAGDWHVAVFENLFPALTAEAPVPPATIVPSRPARGVCEVVVFTQDPTTTLGALSLDRVRLIVDVWADRTAALGSREDVAYVYPFENHGAEVGVTLHHPHGQIYAFPFVPPVAARELAQQSEHWRRTGRGLVAQHIEAELADGERIVYAGPESVAFVPVCARYPYEVWIAPRRPAERLPDLSAAERADLARALKTVLMKYEAMWRRPFPYLMVVHQAPTDGAPHPEAHVHVELLPAYRMPGRLKYAAATEIGAGVFSADARPEDNARELRAVDVDVDFG
jgi:UDPglucose--hexose-1-phosphate uridylyltransferase